MTKKTTQSTDLLVPGDGGLDGVVRVVAGERHVPDGEVEARTPRLDVHSVMS